MVFICGVIAHSKGKNGEDPRFNAVGAIAGNLGYIVLRALKYLLIYVYLLKMKPFTAMLLTLNGVLVSIFKAIVTVVVVLILAPIIQRKMKRVRLS
jgi:hypothetical protein